MSKKSGIKKPLNFPHGETRRGDILETKSWLKSLRDIGYLVLFFIELSAILANEYYDYWTDRFNKNAGPFTGGQGFWSKESSDLLR